MKIFDYEIVIKKIQEHPYVWVRYNKQGRVANVAMRTPKDIDINPDWIVYEVKK